MVVTDNGKGNDVGKVEISNPDGSFLVSDLLADVAQLAHARGVPVSRTGTTTSDHKFAEVLVAIALGVTSSAAYDMLKFVVTRFAKRKDYDEHARVIVNNISVEIGQFLSADGQSPRQTAQSSRSEENFAWPARPDER